MGHVFLSYSSKHRESTRNVAALLEREGYSVWWDRALESWGPYWPQIRAALDAADVVVVLWSEGAAKSDYVYAEALRASKSGKLINLLPSDGRFEDIPEPFNVYHLDRLDPDNPDRLLASIAGVRSGKSIATRVPLHEIYWRQHGIALIETKQRKIDDDPDEISPSELLQASFGIVPYVDVTGTKAEMVSWCDGSRGPTAARLMHGPGGLGKTRLMIEVTADLRRRGWVAGFLREPRAEAKEAEVRLRADALEQIIENGEEPGILIVLDYAEGRQHELTWLSERFRARRRDDARPARMVALTRGMGHWWLDLVGKSEAVRRVFQKGGDTDAIALSDVPHGQPRIDFFNETFLQFARTLGREHPGMSTFRLESRLKRIATDAIFARPLALQMEALVYLYEGDFDAGGGREIDTLLNRVLAVERRHWSKLLGHTDDNKEYDLRRALAQMVAVCGVSTHRAAQDLLMLDGYYKREVPDHARAPLDGLKRVYGTSSGGISHLEPDLLGEHELASVGDDYLIDACLQWIDTLPEDARPERQLKLLTVLQRGTRAEHGSQAKRAKDLLRHIVVSRAGSLARNLIQVSIGTPGGRAGNCDLGTVLLESVPYLDEAAVESLNSALPSRTTRLREFSVALAKQRLKHASAQREVPSSDRVSALSETIMSLVVLASRQREAGESDIASVDEAVRLTHELLANPEALTIEVAPTIQAVCISTRFHKKDDAFRLSDGLIEHLRRLAEQDRDKYAELFASVLTEHGTHLAEVGRHAEATKVVAEVTSLATGVAEMMDDPSKLRNTGLRMISQSLIFEEQGQYQEALSSVEQGLGLYHRGTESKPKHLVDFAQLTLRGRVHFLSKLHRNAEASVAAEEAVLILRRLAEEKPDAYQPDL